MTIIAVLLGLAPKYSVSLFSIPDSLPSNRLALPSSPMVFSENHGGPIGIRDHETDWLTLENALVRASSPRRKIER
jgi:hypothetical protein